MMTKDKLATLRDVLAAAKKVYFDATIANIYDRTPSTRRRQRRAEDAYHAAFAAHVAACEVMGDDSW